MVRNGKNKEAWNEFREATGNPGYGKTQEEHNAYFRWYRKTKYHHKFAELFKSKKYDVCSGRFIYWCKKTGVVALLNEVTEAWYPGRIVFDVNKHRPIVDINGNEIGHFVLTK